MDSNHFKSLLFDMREKILVEEANGLASTQTVELDQSRVGRLSRMDALQSQAMSTEAQRRRQQQLTAIDAALRRIEKGEYGYCLSCGENINEARLAITPAATQCIACADKDYA